MGNLTNKTTGMMNATNASAGDSNVVSKNTSGRLLQEVQGTGGSEESLISAQNLRYSDVPLGLEGIAAFINRVVEMKFNQLMLQNLFNITGVQKA